MRKLETMMEVFATNEDGLWVQYALVTRGETLREAEDNAEVLEISDEGEELRGYPLAHAPKFAIDAAEILLRREYARK